MIEIPAYHIGKMKSWMTELEMFEEGVEGETVEWTPWTSEIFTCFSLLTSIIIVQKLINYFSETILVLITVLSPLSTVTTPRTYTFANPKRLNYNLHIHTHSHSHIISHSLISYNTITHNTKQFPAYSNPYYIRKFVESKPWNFSQIVAWVKYFQAYGY